MLKLFKKNRIMRRFGEDKLVNGYAQASYSDSIVFIDVQPVSEGHQSKDDGERRNARLQVYCKFNFRHADPLNKVRGDWIWYIDRWYECVSAQYWDHTPMSHCKAEFVEIVDSGKHPAPAIDENGLEVTE